MSKWKARGYENIDPSPGNTTKGRSEMTIDETLDRVEHGWGGYAEAMALAEEVRRLRATLAKPPAPQVCNLTAIESELANLANGLAAHGDGLGRNICLRAIAELRRLAADSEYRNMLESNARLVAAGERLQPNALPPLPATQKDGAK